jgi:hypothetical protein
MTIPSWLNPEKEIKHPDQPESFSSLSNKDKASAFICFVLEDLKNINVGLTPRQKLWILSNMISETGWGKTWRGNNFGGWKITKDYVTSYKREHNGEEPWWWQAEGHVASGDEPVVYYRGFEPRQKFSKEWVERFVPKVSDTGHRYHKTGLDFWLEKDTWFRELCLAGYKGPVTQANPEKSCEDFKSICKRAQIILIQTKIGVDHDGSWGPTSKNKAKELYGTDDIDTLFNLIVS